MNLRIVPFAAILIILFATTASANRIVCASPDTAIIQPNVTWVKTFELFSTNFEPPYKWSVQPIGEAPAGEFQILGQYNGSFQFTPSTKDAGKQYSFAITANDNRGMNLSSQFVVRIDKRIPIIIEIEKTHNSLQGQWEYISVSKTSGVVAPGSFNFKICYNGDGLKFDTLTLSDTLIKLGWTCTLSQARTGSFGPLALQAANIQVQASSQARQATPLPDAALFTIKFYVTNDRSYECQFIPIHFAWSSIYDNSFTSDKSDSLFSCLQVIDPEGRDMTSPFSLADCTDRNSNNLAGPCRNARNAPRTVTDVPNIVFRNGGVSLVCAGMPNPSGDLNLNAISYEIADFELMSRWLAFGDSVLDKNPAFREAQIYTSDANQDGTTGSVADMVYLARVIIGDALPFPKLQPYQKIALSYQSHDTIFVESNDSLAGILILFKADEQTSFENLSNIEMITGSRGSLTTLLFKPSLKDLQGHIPSGRKPLVRIRGKSEIQSIEVSDYNGSIMNVRK